MSKIFARSSLCALTMTIMTAHAAEPPTNLDKPEGRLDIIAWPGYIERGQTDKQYDWVTQFEKETGCAVNVKTAATSDEMVSLGTIQAVQYQGAATRFELKLSGGEKLLVSQANVTGEDLPNTLTPGQQVMVSWSRDVMVPLVEER
ncbi:TOBE domain-containing protein [Escherichia coli]|nr:TOBE domain-containing protein [Escherichia coli]EGO1325791.1 TOBE domain-containing protein [Escherichia coli]